MGDGLTDKFRVADHGVENPLSAFFLVRVLIPGAPRYSRRRERLKSNFGERSMNRLFDAALIQIKDIHQGCKRQW